MNAATVAVLKNQASELDRCRTVPQTGGATQRRNDQPALGCPSSPRSGACEAVGVGAGLLVRVNRTLSGATVCTEVSTSPDALRCVAAPRANWEECSILEMIPTNTHSVFDATYRSHPSVGFMDPYRGTTATRSLARSPETERDRVIAHALRQVYGDLHATTCTAYLLTQDATTLATAMTIDTPLAFSVPTGMAAGDLGYNAAHALDAGKLVITARDEQREHRQEYPAVILHCPHPDMLLISAPVLTSRRRFGALSLRWIPSRTPSQEELDYLQATADGLAAELESLADQGNSMEAPAVPLFVPAADRQPEEPSPPPATGSAFLYQLQRLAVSLTAAQHIQDVVTATHTLVAGPFGAQGVMLCVADEGRLHVAGAANFSREAVHRVEGTLLSLHTPETDTVTAVDIKCFASHKELCQAYPDLDHDPEGQARIYLPLITHGHTMGCCVIEFPEPSRPLAPEELAIVMLMLEQVGQSLEQIRSREAGYALIQTMQRMLLPRSLPHLTEAAITGRYLPATAEADVGGDWYDVVTLPGGGIGLVIGDVEGHTLEAAAVMGQLRTAVRAYAAEGHEPAIVLERANQILTGLDTDLYATCCCMWLDLATGIASIATAGHPAPLISSPQGSIIKTQPPVGPPLGINAESLYQQSETRLPPGSVTALITDGLLDARHLGLDPASRQLTDLLTLHRADNPDALADILLQGRPSSASGLDDAALLLLRYEGPHSTDHPRIAQTSVERHNLQGVAHVRQFLRDQLHQWNLDTVLDEMEVLVSEVVTNALIHAHSEVDLRLRALPDRIRVEVRDSDPHPPIPTPIISTSDANQEAESGRGLLIVDALAAAWGSSPAGRGKNTWFEYCIG